jgi:hypothetical protein
LLCNFLILTLLVYPVLFYLFGGIGGRNGSTTTMDYVLLSVDSATGLSGLSSVALATTLARVIAATEVAVGFIAFGLFITILFRRITRWR